MSARRPQRRQVVRRGPHREDVGLIAAATFVALAMVAALTGQVAALLSGAGWPSWQGTGTDLLNPVFGVLAHPSDPMRGWPGVHGPDVPPAWLYWTVAAVLLGSLLTAVAAVARWLRGRRPAPGYAAKRDVRERLGAEALLAQAPRLRPNLARATTRPRVEQLGSRLGRDVNTGVDCFSSVRQSRYVVGPSESGKTSAVVIPEALDHDGPLLAPSSRADVMAATWLARSQQGPVLLFDPLRQAPGLPLVHWDPVRACTDPTVAMRRAQALMSSVDMSGVANGEAWKNRGQAVLRNLLHAAALDNKDIRTVLRWANDPTSVEPASILAHGTSTSESWAEMQHSVINTPERQRAGYYMSVEGALEAFYHPAVLDTCLPGPGRHFDVHRFLDPAGGHATMFLLSQRAQAVAVSDVLAALMEDLLFHARELGQRLENNRLDPPLKFLVDEAPNTATLLQLPDLVADGAGRGIPTTMVVQDRAQAMHRWGREAALSMWGAATIRMVLPGVAGIEEMREIAAYFDDYDEEIPTFSRSHTHGPSEQLSFRERSAMSAANVRSIPALHCLVIAAGGLKPVLTELQPYYQRPDAPQSADSEHRFHDALNDHRSVL